MRSEKGKPVKKGDLPEKPCLACGKPMMWRKKWERDWDQVKFCSDRCRRDGVAMSAMGQTRSSGSMRKPR